MSKTQTLDLSNADRVTTVVEYPAKCTRHASSGTTEVSNAAVLLLGISRPTADGTWAVPGFDLLAPATVCVSSADPVLAGTCCWCLTALHPHPHLLPPVGQAVPSPLSSPSNSNLILHLASSPHPGALAPSSSLQLARAADLRFPSANLEQQTSTSALDSHRRPLQPHSIAVDWR